MPSVRILLADDHQAFRGALRSLLSRRKAWLVCGEAVDGLDAVEKAKLLQPDLVLMDVSMPRMDGIEATKIIRREVPRSEVLLVSQNDSDAMREHAAEVGARGFVSKADLPRDLFQAIDRLVADANAQRLREVQRLRELRCQGDTPLEAVIHTDELQRRPSRNPDYEAENRALSALAQALADSPRTVLQKLSEIAMELCHASSAGVSLLTEDDGGKNFYWPAVTGKLAPFVGGGTPRDFGPCGVVLDTDAVQVFSRPERYYRYLEPISPPIEDSLLTPFYVDGKAAGTVWVIHHDPKRKFDLEDSRLMTSLSHFASVAYRARKAAEKIEQQAQSVLESEERLRLALNAGQLGNWQVDLATLSLTTSTQCKANFGRAADEPFTYEIFRASIHPEDSERVAEAIRQAIETVGDYESDYRCVWPDGSVHWINARGRAAAGAGSNGRAVRMAGVTLDITERKQSEDRLRALAESLDTQVRVRTEELEERNAEVENQAEQLRELSARLMQTQDNERRRMARELHDSAGQTLAALGMNLSRLNWQGTLESNKLIEDSTRLVQDVQQEIRTMSYLLHPPLLDEAGLRPALSWYVDGLQKRSGLEIKLNIPEDLGRLSPEMELAVFRIVQEGLTNVHRHSGSKSAVIRIARTRKRVVVEIRDKGKGISERKLAEIQSRGSGVGIRGMRERLRQVHGELKIDSNGGGTKLSATLPIPSEPTRVPDTIQQMEESQAV